MRQDARISFIVDTKDMPYRGVAIEGVAEIVEESVKFAEESNYPDPSEAMKDVYMQADYPYITD